MLLVDDEATSLDILRETLSGPNYRLFVARSGEDALKVARRARPMIVLLDVVMAGLDGYETCRRLKADPDTRLRGFRAGFLMLKDLGEDLRGSEIPLDAP
jgi:two-component system, LuxR family, sensor kinase FixL